MLAAQKKSRAPLYAGLVILAAGMRAAAGPLNMVLLAMLLAGTIYPLPYAMTRRGWSTRMIVV